MANYSSLKSAVTSVIKTNGNKEITGAVLQSTLLAIINSLGDGFIYKGIATSSTDPGTPDQNVFYLAGAGTYSNFGSTSQTIPEGRLGVFKYNGTWALESIQVGDPNAVKYVEQALSSSEKWQARENIEAISKDEFNYLKTHLGVVGGDELVLNYSSMELRVYKPDGTYVTLGSAATGRTIIYNLPANSIDFKAYVSSIGSSATYAGCVSVIYWDSNNTIVGTQYPQGSVHDGNVLRDLVIPAGATKMGIYVTPYASNGCTYHSFISIDSLFEDIGELTNDISRIDSNIDGINDEIDRIKEDIGLANSGYIDPLTDRVGYWIRYDTGALKQYATGDVGIGTKMRTQNYQIPADLDLSDITFKAMYGTAASSNYSNFAAVAYYATGNVYISGVCFYQQGGSTENKEHILTLPEGTRVIRLFTYSDDAAVAPYLYYESSSSHTKTILFADPQELTPEQQQQVKDNLDLNFGATYTLQRSSLQLRVYKTDGTYIEMASTSNGRTVIYNLPTTEGARNFQAYVSGIGSSSTYAGCVAVIYWDDSNNVVGYEYPQGQSANAVVELNIPEGATKVGIWVNPYSNESFTYDVGEIPIYKPEVLELINGTKIPLSLEGKKVSIIGDSIACFGTEAQTRNQGYNAPYFIIQASDVGHEIQSYITWVDLYVSATSNTRISPTPTIGGVELTTAMIGTLQTFTPVAADVGKALGVPRWAQPYTTKPWWQVFIDAVGAELCNNASWSGSEMCEISTSSSRYSAFRMSEAYSEYTLNRVCKRDSEGNRIVPDIIFICRGTNDWGASYPDPEGGGAGVAESLEFPNMVNFVGVENGQNANFCEAYIWTILRLREKYPFALICCCTILDSGRGDSKKYPPLNGSNDSISDFNEAIRKIADYMGCPLIDLAKCGITWYNAYPTYMDDSNTSPTHPNAKGHRLMGQKAVADLTYLPAENGSLTPYTVTYNLTNCKCNNMNTTVWGNCAYLGKLIPTSGTLSVTITMGGTNVTSSVYRSADSSIRIKRITGNIVITATAS